MDALTSARRKIYRAGQQLLPVLDVIDRYARTNPYTFVHSYDREARRQNIQIRQEKGLDGVELDPIELGLTLGEAVHNMRSALDHLAWGLACKNSKTPIALRRQREIFFPIMDTYEAFMTHSTIPFLTLEQIAVIERHQPFEGRDDKRLRRLNSLWNADKHQVIQPVLSVLPQTGIKLVPNEDAGRIVERCLLPKVTFDPDAEDQWVQFGWIEVSAPGPNPHVHVESLTVQIVAGEGPKAPEVSDLGRFHDLVVEIANECAPLFEA